MCEVIADGLVRACLCGFIAQRKAVIDHGDPESKLPCNPDSSQRDMSGAADNEMIFCGNFFGENGAERRCKGADGICFHNGKCCPFKVLCRQILRKGIL